MLCQEHSYREFTLSICPVKFMFILMMDLQSATSGQYICFLASIGCLTHRCCFALLLVYLKSHIQNNERHIPTSYPQLFVVVFFFSIILKNSLFYLYKDVGINAKTLSNHKIQNQNSMSAGQGAKGLQRGFQRAVNIKGCEKKSFHHKNEFLNAPLII